MLRNYANFSGKTTRKQFWSAITLHIIILLLSDLGILMTSPRYTAGESNLFLVLFSFNIFYRFLTWFPLWTITVRRLHDIQKTGWWILIQLIPIFGQIVLVVFLLMKSKETRMEKILFDANPRLRAILNKPRNGGWIWLPLILTAVCIIYYIKDQQFQNKYLSAVSFFAEEIRLSDQTYTDIGEKTTDLISSIQNHRIFSGKTVSETAVPIRSPEITKSQTEETRAVQNKSAVTPEAVVEYSTETPISSKVILESNSLKSKSDQAVIVRIQMDPNNNSTTDESALHESDLNNDFWIDQYEVTNQQYHRCETSGFCTPPNNVRSAKTEDYYINDAYSEYPVIHVTYEQASSYCNWAGRRLPTDSEWQSAAENESEDPYPWGKTFSKDKVNAADSGNRDTTAVGTYPRGKTKDSIFDLAGNVWEWVNQDNDSKTEAKFIRGGAWNSYAISVQTTSKLLVSSDYYADDLGFRCGISTREINPADYNEHEIMNDDPADTDSPDIGSERDRESDGMIEVFIPEGNFVMGNPNGAVNEKPAHTVFLSSFWMDKFEVSNQQYASCVNAGVCTEPGGKNSFKRKDYYGNPEFENYPVIQVTWQQASDYCHWIEGRLPTEAEWEKAAKGLDGTLYPWGNEFVPQNLNFSGSGINDTQPVDMYENGMSGYGILNLSGNVAEWVSDLYAENWYSTTNQPENPTGPENGAYRILRGGSWLTSQNTAQTVNRFQSLPTGAGFDRGFRCVRQD